jgi:hypothetical protein
VRGPHGKGFLSILADFAALSTQPGLVSNLDEIRSWLATQPFIRNQRKGRLTYYLSFFRVEGICLLTKLLPILQSSHTLSKWGFPTLGRLAYFDDVGGKKRYVALGNWLIQGVLRPLHDVIIVYLRSLQSDCTYDQQKVHS